MTTSVATVRPLRGVRYDPARVDLSACLAPPYDVIGDAERRALATQDPHNIVGIDAGVDEPGDVAGVADRYSRAAALLHAWTDAGVLRRDERPALYVHDHGFRTEDGRTAVRRGVVLRVRALPWGESDVLPHEHTLRGPKEDRLRLMRATSMQTSAVFLLWDGAADVDEVLAAATAGPPAVRAQTPGDDGVDTHALWVVDDPVAVVALGDALAPARLYMADGHHRFETAAAYAAERRAADPAAGPDADHAWTLAYVCSAGDPTLQILPTHRLVLPGPGVPGGLDGLLARLDGRYAVERRPTLADAEAAAIAVRAGGRHAFGVSAPDGAALVHRAADPAVASPRERLDVSVAETDLLVGAAGLDSDRIGGGALAYTRSVEEAARAVASGSAAFAITVGACSARQMMDVSDAGEQMPQKSTFFTPKVPTGLVLSPL